VLPAVESTNNPQMTNKFLLEMIKTDELTSTQVTRDAKFSIASSTSYEMRTFNDDIVDESAEVLAEDELSDVLP
jgi:hypothetical protein